MGLSTASNYDKVSEEVAGKQTTGKGPTDGLGRSISLATSGNRMLEYMDLSLT